MEELRKNVVAELEMKLGEGYKITPYDKTKNNGHFLHGICIHKENEPVSPVIYVEDFIWNRNTGKPVPGEIADTILKVWNQHDIPQNIADNVCDIQAMKEKIRLRLVNYDANLKELENVPHRKFLDLAVTYYLDMDSVAGQRTSASITNKLMEEWGITEDELYRLSTEKLLKEDGCMITDMLDVLRKLAQEGEDTETEIALAELKKAQPSPEMFVVSNQKNLFGAGCLLNTSRLQGLAESVGHSLIIFPSSIHELVIIPQKNGSEDCISTEDIQAINTAEVAREECLSNSIYRYDREKREVTILKEGEPLSW